MIFIRGVLSHYLRFFEVPREIVIYSASSGEIDV